MNNIESIATTLISLIIILGFLKFHFIKLNYHIDKAKDEIKDNLVNKVEGNKLASMTNKGDAGRRF